jgi:hypothetical protein
MVGPYRSMTALLAAATLTLMALCGCEEKPSFLEVYVSSVADISEVDDKESLEEVVGRAPYINEVSLGMPMIGYDSALFIHGLDYKDNKGIAALRVYDVDNDLYLEQALNNNQSWLNGSFYQGSVHIIEAEEKIGIGLTVSFPDAYEGHSYDTQVGLVDVDGNETLTDVRTLTFEH